jgi:hypothetical protein
MLKKILVGLVSIFLLVACFQVTPISISLGQDDKAMDGKKRLDLRPGECYLVYSDKPVTLPDGVRWMSAESMGAGFRHDGMHKNKPERCAGFIKMHLQDNGHIEYQCVLCEREWIRDAEGKLVKSCEEK